jgi:hypothetical protein
VRIELIFQRNTAYLSGLYLQCEEHYFVQTSHFQVNGRSTVCLLKERLMLQARGPRTLFGIVNSVSWLKDYGLPLSVSMGEEHQLFAKSPHSNEWKKQCSSCKRIINVTSKRVYMLFTSENWVNSVASGRESLMFEARLSSTLIALWIELAVERNTAYISVFHWWGTSTLCKIISFKWMEQALHLL